MRIVIRPVTDSDHNFIYATYIRNRWFDKGNVTTLKRSTWSAMQHKRLEGLLGTQGSCVIACLDEDSDTIVGYSFWDGRTPFTYIKLSWRQLNPSVKEQLLKELTKNEEV